MRRQKQYKKTIFFSDSSDIEVDGEVDVSFHEDADIERPAQEEIPTYSISQVDTVEDATTLDISETTSEIEIENEEVEYMRTIFPRRNGETEEAYLKRLSCISHRLQLVMAIFDKFRISHTRLPRIGQTNRLPAFATVISNARKLVSRFNTSSIATPRLIELSGRKLLSDVSTRWSSNFFVMDCLYELRQPVSQALVERDIF